VAQTLLVAIMRYCAVVLRLRRPERAEGASVTEIGQRLGWLPHTVRAAITGLRHAGREVTRSRDKNGQSVYRLGPVETPDR
jgi:DNA-binding transcriptional regulator PaaX